MLKKITKDLGRKKSDHPSSINKPLMNKVRNCHPSSWFIAYLLIMRFVLILLILFTVIRHKQNQSVFAKSILSGVLNICM